MPCSDYPRVTFPCEMSCENPVKRHIPFDIGCGSPPKRQYLVFNRKHKHNNSAEESVMLRDRDGDEPCPKMRITESKMVSRLNNFHITPIVNQTLQNNDCFWMQKPQNSFEEIESRLSSSDEEDMEDEVDASEGTLRIDPSVSHLIKGRKESFSPWLRQPESSLAVVLWKPPGDFVADLVPDIDGNHETEEDIDDLRPYVTFPSTEGERVTLTARRRSPDRLCGSPRPVIEEMEDMDV